ncbi:Molybdenum cofactor biosynthesis protein MoaD [Methanosarcina lacustris Z-7289]|uniref:Molybdenum cofactor biosynthesis protein MoaD n=1 Tax=Methanosarcina lacustris Z-7289 TaxID=1434111 RepID=A0A0E3S6Q8_9EURY|nr:MoaD family protein [Methanosarcina lacustris]AKB74678.1 Molybdenum cofactor biosynthesis protein MoaD [Methanosarcina lacustris Z-7289]
MKILVKFLASIRNATQEPEISIKIHPRETVEVLLKALKRHYGEGFREAVGRPFEDERPRIKVLVNGRNIDFLKGAETELKDGDVVVLFPPIAGG